MMVFFVEGAAIMLIEDLVEWYGRHRDITPESVRQMGAVVRSFEKWAGRTVHASEFEDDFVNDWVIAMTSNGLAKITAKTRRGRLLTLWRAAHRMGHCETTPGEIRTVKVPFKAPVAWSVEDVRKILDVAESLRWPFRCSNVCRGQFFGLAIRLAWDTALRFCDLTRLEKNEFDAEGVATITQSKTGRWHVVRIHESTRELMMRFVPDDDRALAWTIEYSNFEHQFKRIVKRAGLVGPWKKIRKGSASNVELHHSGCGAAHLGHVAGSIAHNHYLDPRIIGSNRPMPQEL